MHLLQHHKHQGWWIRDHIRPVYLPNNIEEKERADVIWSTSNKIIPRRNRRRAALMIACLICSKGQPLVGSGGGDLAHGPVDVVVDGLQQLAQSAGRETPVLSWAGVASQPGAPVLSASQPGIPLLTVSRPGGAPVLTVSRPGGAPVLISTRPGAQALTFARPGAPVLTVSRPGGAPVLTATRPGAKVLIVARPGAPVLTVARPGAPVLISTRPGAPVLTVARPGAPVLTVSRPGAPVLISTRPGAPVLTVVRPGAPVQTTVGPGSRLLAVTELRPRRGTGQDSSNHQESLHGWAVADVMIAGVWPVLIYPGPCFRLQVPLWRSRSSFFSANPSPIEWTRLYVLMDVLEWLQVHVFCHSAILQNQTRRRTADAQTSRCVDSPQCPDVLSRLPTQRPSILLS